MTTQQLIDQALQALKPDIGFPRPSQQQVQRADAIATIAIASALDRIAGALEEIAFNHSPDTTVQPAIRHST
jgi:hypothetical protein